MKKKSIGGIVLMSIGFPFLAYLIYVVYIYVFFGVKPIDGGRIVIAMWSAFVLIGAGTCPSWYD